MQMHLGLLLQVGLVLLQLEDLDLVHQIIILTQHLVPILQAHHLLLVPQIIPLILVLALKITILHLDLITQVQPLVLQITIQHLVAKEIQHSVAKEIQHLVLLIHLVEITTRLHLVAVVPLRLGQINQIHSVHLIQVLPDLALLMLVELLVRIIILHLEVITLLLLAQMHPKLLTIPPTPSAPTTPTPMLHHLELHKMQIHLEDYLVEQVTQTIMRLVPIIITHQDLEVLVVDYLVVHKTMLQVERLVLISLQLVVYLGARIIPVLAVAYLEAKATPIIQGVDYLDRATIRITVPGACLEINLQLLLEVCLEVIKTLQLLRLGDFLVILPKTTIPTRAVVFSEETSLPELRVGYLDRKIILIIQQMHLVVIRTVVLVVDYLVTNQPVLPIQEVDYLEPIIIQQVAREDCLAAATITPEPLRQEDCLEVITIPVLIL
mmetsp:Transcript_6860/g.8717  ORF Transcript_6860/g.8717 Transcript_6860/m.8717 type:complete len:436 (+) Transcript_6860:738-2045(+)